MDKTYIGGIEAGGTNFNCALADSSGQLLERISFATGDPADTLARAAAFFKQQSPSPLGALGVACFGPVELDRSSDRYGQLLHTPKPAGPVSICWVILSAPCKCR